MPDVPTMKEAGVDGVEVPVWYALLAPAATPREIVKALGDATARAARSPDTQARRWSSRAPIRSATRPRNSRKLLREEVANWAEVVRISGAKAD